MAVPAPDAFDSLALHGLIAWDGVFDDGAEEGAVVWAAGDEWWAVVEDVRVLLWAVFDGFFEDFVLFPPVN